MKCVLFLLFYSPWMIESLFLSVWTRANYRARFLFQDCRLCLLQTRLLFNLTCVLCPVFSCISAISPVKNPDPGRRTTHVALNGPITHSSTIDIVKYFHLYSEDCITLLCHPRQPAIHSHVFWLKLSLIRLNILGCEFLYGSELPVISLIIPHFFVAHKLLQHSLLSSCSLYPLISSNHVPVCYRPPPCSLRCNWYLTSRSRSPPFTFSAWFCRVIHSRDIPLSIWRNCNISIVMALYASRWLCLIFYCLGL